MAARARKFSWLNLFWALPMVTLAVIFFAVPRFRVTESETAYRDFKDPLTSEILEVEKQQFSQMASTTILDPKFHTHFGILMYHHIDHDPTHRSGWLSVTPENLDKQIGYLITQGYRFVTLNTAYNFFQTASTTPPDKTLVLTFDDGYRSFYTGAYPLLKKYHVPATVFVITQDIDKRGNVTWAMMKEMVASGLVEIGGHTVNHRNLRHLSALNALDQFARGKAILESGLGIKVTTAAYPYGAYSSMIKKVAAAAGFKGAVGIFSAEPPRWSNKFAWRRVTITNRELGLALLRKIYLAFEVAK